MYLDIELTLDSEAGIPDSDFETMIYDSKVCFCLGESLGNGNSESGPPQSCAYHGRESDCHRLFHCLL